LDALPAGDYFVAPRLRSNDPWKGSHLSSVGAKVTVRGGETADLGLIVWASMHEFMVKYSARKAKRSRLPECSCA
jgi:hypothetical protein